MVNRKRTVFNGTQVGYVEIIPDDYNPALNYPLIIFLHGVGERGSGSDADLQYLYNNMPARLKEALNLTHKDDTGKLQKFICLAPQLSKSLGSWRTLEVSAMFEVAKYLAVNNDMVYLTGLSLGGGGVWNFISADVANGSQLAAIIPVCPVNASGNVCNAPTNKLGVWNFHAMDDSVVGVGNSQSFEYKLNQCTVKFDSNFQYFSSGGHNIWERVYDVNSKEFSPNIYEWLLKNRVSQTSPAPKPTFLNPNAVVVEGGTDIVTTQASYWFSVLGSDGKWVPKNGASVGANHRGFWPDSLKSETGVWIEGNPYGSDWNFGFGGMVEGRTYTMKIIAQNQLGQQFSDTFNITRVAPNNTTTTIPVTTTVQQWFSKIVTLQYADGDNFVKVDTEVKAIYFDPGMTELKGYILSDGSEPKGWHKQV